MLILSGRPLGLPAQAVLSREGAKALIVRGERVIGPGHNRRNKLSTASISCLNKCAPPPPLTGRKRGVIPRNERQTTGGSIDQGRFPQSVIRDWYPQSFVNSLLVLFKMQNNLASMIRCYAP